MYYKISLFSTHALKKRMGFIYYFRLCFGFQMFYKFKDCSCILYIICKTNKKSPLRYMTIHSLIGYIWNFVVCLRASFVERTVKLKKLKRLRSPEISPALMIDFDENEKWYFKVLQGTLSSLRPFVTTDSLLKMMEITFYFMLKAHFILKVFTFLPRLFGYVEKWLDKKVTDDFKIHHITDWKTNNHNAYYYPIPHETWSVINFIASEIYISSKHMQKMRQWD